MSLITTTASPAIAPVVSPTTISQIDNVIQQQQQQSPQSGLAYGIQQLESFTQAVYPTTTYGDSTQIAGDKAWVSSNPNYVVKLLKNSMVPISVVGNSPADFEMSFTNEYGSLFDSLSSLVSSGGAEGWFGQAVDAAADAATGAAFGLGFGTLFSSIQVWKGSSPLDFTIPITFRAYSDPMVEVINPVRSIIIMSSPARSQAPGANALGIIRSPGPSFGDLSAQYVSTLLNQQNFLMSLPNAITLFFGKKIVIPGLLVTSLHIKFSNRAHRKTGLPIACDVNIGLRTVYAFTQDEILALFFGNFAQSTPSTRNTSAIVQGTGG